MNDLNKHEQDFKNVLESISYDVDSSELWHSIKDRLPLEEKRKKRPIYFFFLYGLGVTFLLGIIIYPKIDYFDSKGTKTVIQYTDLGASQNNQYHSKKNSHYNLGMHSTETILSKENLMNNILSEFDKNQNTTDSKVILGHSSNSNNGQIVNTSQENKKGHLGNTISLSNDTKKSIDSVFRFEETILSEDNEMQASVDKADVLLNNFNGIIPNNYIKSQDKLSPNIIEIESIKYTSINNSNNLDIFIDDACSIDVVNTGIDNVNYFLNAKFGFNIGIVQNTIKDSNSEFNVVKFENELSRIGVSAEFTSGIETKLGWRWFGGVNYNQEIYNYINTSIEVSTISEPGITALHIDSDGNTTEVEGPVYVNKTIDFDLSRHRRHQRLALIGGVAKRLALNRRFSIDPEFSVLYDMNQEHSGYYFSEDNGDIEKFLPSNVSPYSKDSQLKYRFGIGLHYNIKNISLGFVSTYIYNPNNYLEESTFYRSKSNLFSTQLSMNFYFN